MDTSWAKDPFISKPIKPIRGQSITGIEVFRDGPFRSKHGAFRMTLGNDGWGRAGNATTVLNELLNDSDPNEVLLWRGSEEAELVEKATSLVRFGFSTEQLPYSTNRVCLSTQVDESRYSAAENRILG